MHNFLVLPDLHQSSIVVRQRLFCAYDGGLCKFSGISFKAQTADFTSSTPSISKMNTTLPSAFTSETYTQYDGDNSPLGASNQLPHKRNRTQLSCTNCRHAKLKCDRHKPHCSQCVKKGRGSSCNFLPAARKKQTVSMQNRLQHLESLVKGVITGQSPSLEPVNDKPQRRNGKAPSISHSVAVATGVQDHDTDPTAVSLVSSGKVLLGSDESTYVGATHWAAILEDVTFSNRILNKD